MLLKCQRLLQLKQHYKNNNIELAENHVKLLEKFEPKFREHHIRADFTGYLVAMDHYSGAEYERQDTAPSLH